MTSRHLPAGQNIPPAPGVATSGMGMPPVIDGPPPIAGPMPGHHGAPVRRGGRPPAHAGPPSIHPQYAPQYHHNMMNSPMYHGYGGPQQYYQQQYYTVPPPYSNGIPPPYATGMPAQYQNGLGGGQYQNGGMASPGYNMPYQNYQRTPPVMHQPSYAPMVGVTVDYSRQQMSSPALARSFQPPSAPIAMTPQTPTSVPSPQIVAAQTPPVPQIKEFIPRDSMPKEFVPKVNGSLKEFVPAASQHPVQVPAPAPSEESSPAPIRAPVVVESKVPPPAPVPTTPVAQEPFRAPLPWLSCPDSPFPKRSSKLRTRRKHLAFGQTLSLPTEQQSEQLEMQAQAAAEVAPTAESSEVSARPQTPPTHQALGKTPSVCTQEASETLSPASTSPTTPHSVVGQRSRANTTTNNCPIKPSPAVAAKPAVPLVSVVPKQTLKPVATEPKKADVETVETPVPAEAANEDAVKVKVDEAPVKMPPSSWANLFTKKQTESQNGSGVNGHDGGSQNGAPASSVAEAIRTFKVTTGDRLSYIEPRGLINTGNMCYMNSVLQVLMFCTPFYDFLHQVSSKAAHSFKSDTPLIDAMILFMQEFKVLKSVDSSDKLRRLLKAEDIEKYGDPFTPEFVYEAIRQLPRFSSMIRGHQQDAEEFLGFLLQSLDDECVNVMRTSVSAHRTSAADAMGSSDDWLEVGRKQKAAVTRSAGSSVSTPINKIFGGFLRSEFRVPGLKDSITLEPYQPLQLDIGSADVHSVADALRGLTHPERLQGDFNSPRGKDAVATKQVFIETLPPVLILHLKRFKFDAEGHGTVKIWKKIDYPLELEIPREALSRQKREASLPKYKLVSVVYHHGKNASGGHYTVDVRRQDGQNWLRLDDTVLRRVRSDDVAEAGAQEESRQLANQKESAPVGGSGNRFAMHDDEGIDDGDWKQVTGSSSGNKRWSSAINGNSGSSTKSKQHKENIRDNKVAYILFYQRA